MDFRFHWRVRDVFSGRRGRENLLSINFTREYRFFFFFSLCKKVYFVVEEKLFVIDLTLNIVRLYVYRYSSTTIS